MRVFKRTLLSASLLLASSGIAYAGCGIENSKDYKDVMIAALTSSPAEYSSVIVNNGVLVTLMNDGLVRSLDDLIAKHGSSLKKNQLITVDGKVMAVVRRRACRGKSH